MTRVEALANRAQAGPNAGVRGDVRRDEPGAGGHRRSAEQPVPARFDGAHHVRGAGARDRTEHRSSSQVVAIDGDGSLLMNLGSLATIGARQPASLTAAARQWGARVGPRCSDVLGSHRPVRRRARLRADTQEVGRDRGSSRDALRDVIQRGRPHLLLRQDRAGQPRRYPWLHADPVVLGEWFRTWVARWAK